MGINGVNSNYVYYNRAGYNNFAPQNSYNNSPIFTGSNGVVGDSFRNRTLTHDAKDDGSIGFGGAVKNLFKGVGNFFKGMVCDESGKFSLTRTLTTIGMGVAIGAACAFLPTIAIAGTTFSTLGLISAGFLGFAGLHAGSAALDIMDAKTDADAEKAWQSMGSALTEGGLAYLGYRAAGGIHAKNTVPTSPSGSTPKTPKTPKSEGASETPTGTPTPKPEPVVEAPPVESEVVITETIVEEPVITTPVTEPIVKPVVEKPAMTMTAEAKVQYNNTKALIENSRHKVNAETIDEQFATPKELAEMKEFYEKAEAEAKAEAEVEVTPQSDVQAETPNIESTQSYNTKPVYDKTTGLQLSDHPVVFKDFCDQYNLSFRTLERADKEGRTLSNPMVDHIREVRNAMDDLIELQKPSEVEYTAYRGVDIYGSSSTLDSVTFRSVYENAKPGDIITPDAGFQFVASNKGVAGEYGRGNGGVIIEMHFPIGTKMMHRGDITTPAYEGMVPRNASFEVISNVKLEDGSRYIVQKYILPESSKPVVAKPKAEVETIDEQFATPKELTEMNKRNMETKSEEIVNNLKNPVSDKVESWYDSEEHIKPYVKEDETMVKGHHYFHGGNESYNQTLETMMEPDKQLKYTDSKEYNRIYRLMTNMYNRITEKLLKSNVEFTKLTPQPRDCVAYRGTCRNILRNRQDFDVINSANVGDEIVPTRGFAYAAHHKFGTYQYLGHPYDINGNIAYEPMLVEYRIPKGAQVSTNMEHGGEVVFPALSKFKLLLKETRLIEKLDQSGNAIGSFPYRHVILEYIPEIPLPKA